MRMVETLIIKFLCTLWKKFG